MSQAEDLLVTERTESAVESRNRKGCPGEFIVACRVTGGREPKNEPAGSPSSGAMVNTGCLTGSRISWDDDRHPGIPVRDHLD